MLPKVIKAHELFTNTYFVVISQAYSYYVDDNSYKIVRGIPTEKDVHYQLRIKVTDWKRIKMFESQILIGPRLYLHT